MIRIFLPVMLTALFPVFAPAARAHADGGNKYALLVGVRTYDHDKLGDLKHTENDVEELGKVLARAGFQVTLLTSTRGQTKADAKPTRKNIRARLTAILAGVTKHDLVLVGLAGHGLQLPVTVGGADKDESFFCPTDARPRDTKDAKELGKTMLGLSDLFKELDESGAGVKLLLVDACRNDPILGRNVNIDSLPRPPSGTAALFSCKSGERAFESDKLGGGHGVFFYHVLQGFKGEAKNQRGEITWASLAEYVTDRVSDQVPTLIGGGAQQTPQEIRNLTGKSPILVEPPKPSVRTGAGTGNEAEELFQRGREVFEGTSGKVDLVEAARLFDRARSKGHLLAAAVLGTMYQTGLGVKQDRVKAGWLGRLASAKVREQAAAGDVVAMNVLGFMYSTGMSATQNHQEALKWYQQAADRGYPLAQANLGLAYAGARGVARNDYTAVTWYRKAADQGSAFGQAGLGTAYLTGQGVARDAREGIELLRKSAQQGLSLGQAALGFAYLHGGRGVGEYREALQWFQKAVEQNCTEGLVGLGQAAQMGRGMRQDWGQAVKGYRQAADLGNATGQYYLAQMYFNGQGVPMNFPQGIQWCERAANEGLLIAQLELANRYTTGFGVPSRNPTEALKWYRKAADQGDAFARQQLKTLENKR